MWFPSIEPLFSPFLFFLRPVEASIVRCSQWRIKRVSGVVTRYRGYWSDLIIAVLNAGDGAAVCWLLCVYPFFLFLLFFSSCDITFDSRRNRYGECRVMAGFAENESRVIFMLILKRVYVCLSRYKSELPFEDEFKVIALILDTLQ
jgi:hypothetical protein